MEHRRVLVIDDLHHIESMIRGGLLYYPVEMSFSTSKNDALKSILKQPPDLIISGLVFGDGTAAELVQEIKSIMTFTPPGIFLTDENQAEAKNEIIKLGAVDVISRPFEMSALHHKIDHAVKVMKTYNVKDHSDEYKLLLEESKDLGIPVAELIKLKQVSSE